MNQDTKVCSKCKEEKYIDQFYFRKDSQTYRKICKKCWILKSKSWILNNPIKRKEGQKRWRLKTPEKQKIYSRKRYLKYHDKFLLKSKNRRSNNLKYFREYEKNRRQSDPIYKLTCNIRRLIHHVVKDLKKLDHTIILIGCSAAEFKIYIESLFTENMTWDNYGKNGWDIDHIIPCAWFKKYDMLKNLDDQKRCFHYTNCRPMWHIDNIKKGNKTDGMKLLYRDNTPFI